MKWSKFNRRLKTGSEVMIYLSAQPDEYYFLWQLKLQLFNFESHGIDRNSIHVLIGYSEEKGLNPEFTDFIKNNNQALFFTYPDTRIQRNYSPALRPHIIAKHYRAMPFLNAQPVFYHDSDILFRVLPDFDLLTLDDVWYVSNSSSYLDSNYIKRAAGAGIFEQMCALVGIAPDVVIDNDINAGGAQYLIKNADIEFWDKIEKDSEALYSMLEIHNGQAGFCRRDTYENRIQSWCADMWCIWWNALLFKRKFQIHSDLNFCWANSPIKEWNHRKILHYTGSSKQVTTVFHKGSYLHHEPFYDDLSKIDKSTCSYELRSLLDQYVKKQNAKRVDLRDVSFLISVRIDSEERHENLCIVIRYLTKFFDTNIHVLEVDKSTKVNLELLPPGIRYTFIEDTNDKLHRTKYNNFLVQSAETKYIAIYNTDIIIPVEQIVSAVHLLRCGVTRAVSPYDGSFVSVGSLLKAMFSKLLDPLFLVINEKKASIGVKRSYGGTVFLDHKTFVESGLDNEHITSWGPEDIERIKRMQILGFKVNRLPGSIYHLPHPRGSNGGYQSGKEHERLMLEYLKVCSLSKEELTNYIESWPWVNQLVNDEV